MIKMEVKSLKKIITSGKVGRTGTRSRSGDVLIMLVLFGTAVFMGLPFVYAIMQSLKPMEELFIYPPRFYVVNPTINNYYMLFKYMGSMWVPFSRYLFNSLFVTFVATTAEIIFCSMAAYVLSKGRFRYKNVVFSIIVVTLLFSYDVTAVPSYVIISGLGLINNHGALILPAIALPLGLFLLKQFMEMAVPDSLIEAAQIDGASSIRIYWTIAMPMIKPAWLTLIIFSFQQIWSREGLEYIYDESLKVLPTMFRQIVASGIGRSDIAAAATVVLMVPPIVIFILAQNRVLETMAHSGIK